MSRHDPRVRLLHMRDFAREAVQMASTRTRTDLDDDRMFALALSRLVELVGEAAAKLSPEERGAYAVVPWRDVIGMRNRLIHGYDYVDHDILWAAVTGDLPPLLSALEVMLAEGDQSATNDQ